HHHGLPTPPLMSGPLRSAAGRRGLADLDLATPAVFQCAPWVIHLASILIPMELASGARGAAAAMARGEARRPVRMPQQHDVPPGRGGRAARGPALPTAVTGLARRRSGPQRGTRRGHPGLLHWGYRHLGLRSGPPLATCCW